MLPTLKEDVVANCADDDTIPIGIFWIAAYVICAELDTIDGLLRIDVNSTELAVNATDAVIDVDDSEEVKAFFTEIGGTLPVKDRVPSAAKNKLDDVIPSALMIVKIGPPPPILVNAYSGVFMVCYSLEILMSADGRVTGVATLGAGVICTEVDEPATCSCNVSLTLK